MSDRKFVVAVFIVGLLLGAILGIVYSMYTGRYVQPSPSSYEVHFSPNGGCANTIVYWIGRANQEDGSPASQERFRQRSMETNVATLKTSTSVGLIQKENLRLIPVEWTSKGWICRRLRSHLTNS